MPVPFVTKVGKSTGRGTKAAEADWARAKEVIQKEYGDIPDARRYALVTKVFKNITKGHTSEMMLSGTSGGFRDAPIGMVVAGGPDLGPARVRPVPDRKKKPKARRESVAEDMPLNTVANLPSALFHQVDADTAGYQAPDLGDAGHDTADWSAAKFPKGTKIGQPKGAAVINGRRHNVYGHEGKLHALPSDAAVSQPHPAPMANEAVVVGCPYTPQGVAAALSKAGVRMARHGAAHEASGAEVIKVGGRVGWRWRDHAGAGDRVMGEIGVVNALGALGLRTIELRPGDGAWIVLPPEAAEAAADRPIRESLGRACKRLEHRRPQQPVAVWARRGHGLGYVDE